MPGTVTCRGATIRRPPCRGGTLHSRGTWNATDQEVAPLPAASRPRKTRLTLSKF